MLIFYSSCSALRPARNPPNRNQARAPKRLLQSVLGFPLKLNSPILLMSLRPTLKQSQLLLPQKRKSAKKHCLVKLPRLEKRNGFLNIQVLGIQASSNRLLSQRVLWTMMIFLTEVDKLMETLSGRRIRYVLVLSQCLEINC